MQVGIKRQSPPDAAGWQQQQGSRRGGAPGGSAGGKGGNGGNGNNGGNGTNNGGAAGGAGWQHGGKGYVQQLRPGEWGCSCGFANRPHRTVCLGCGKACPQGWQQRHPGGGGNGGNSKGGGGKGHVDSWARDRIKELEDALAAAHERPVQPAQGGQRTKGGGGKGSSSKGGKGGSKSKGKGSQVEVVTVDEDDEDWDNEEADDGGSSGSEMDEDGEEDIETQLQEAIEAAKEQDGLYRHAFRVTFKPRKFNEVSEQEQFDSLQCGPAFSQKRELDRVVARLREAKRDTLPVSEQYRGAKRDAKDKADKVDKTLERIAGHKAGLEKVVQEAAWFRTELDKDQALLQEQQARSATAHERLEELEKKAERAREPAAAAEAEGRAPGAATAVQEASGMDQAALEAMHAAFAAEIAKRRSAAPAPPAVPVPAPATPNAAPGAVEHHAPGGSENSGGPGAGEEGLAAGGGASQGVSASGKLNIKAARALEGKAGKDGPYGKSQ